MSYILEALKKLEEKRRRAETPNDLLTHHESAPLHVERRAPWHYVVLAALILNAGLLLWWLRPWQPSGAHRVEDHMESKASAAPPLPEAMARPERESGTPGKMTSESAPTTEGRDNNVIPDSPGRPAVATEQADLNVAQNKIGDRKVCNFNDLPPSVRQDLPAVTIAGHFYSSDPSSRIVVINGKIMREGQVIVGNMRLEQITPDGVVMSFQGYRFRRGVF
jgi:general secretion pathway protein B